MPLLRNVSADSTRVEFATATLGEGEQSDIGRLALFYSSSSSCDEVMSSRQPSSVDWTPCVESAAASW